MREIKFRAWDNVEDKMARVTSIDFRNEHVSIEGDGYTMTDTFEMFELMQYTGLTDKNGKEIYEGDILKTTYHAGTLKERVFIKYVSYDLGMFIVTTKGSSMGTSLGSEVTKAMNPQVEVIGNIYENKELME